MRHTTDTLPERGVLVHQFARSLEKWYGILINVPVASEIQGIKHGLDVILEGVKELPSFEKEGLIHCKGTYLPATLDKLKQYISRISNAVILKGTYEDLLGTCWVEENMKKVNYTG